MVTVREATIADVDTVYELIIAIAKHHNQTQYVVTNKEELINSGFGNKVLFGVLIAEVDGEVAGYCSYTWNYSIWLGSSYMNIDDVFVWQSFRGKQVGKSIMLKAKEICLAKGVARINWQVEQDNHGAIKFYQGLGANLDVKGFFRWDISPKA